ncbi:MAG: glycosyltransferase, partial [Armatimonadetes bacterium]|nr:glycosyltransferase [Armatimonadota bacterium]
MEEPLRGIRVAFVAVPPPPRGWGTLGTYCRALRELGAEVELVLIGAREVSAEQQSALDFPIHLLNHSKHSSNKRTSRALSAALNKIRPQIVHAWGYDASIHASRAVAEGLQSRLIVEQPDARQRFWRRVRAWRLRRWPVRVISPSPSASRTHQQWYGYPPQRCMVLASPIRAGAFNPPPPDEALAEELGIIDAYPVVIWPALLKRLKGHADLLRAWREVVAEYPRGRLLLVGDGKLRSQLVRLAQSLGVGGSVLFTGFRPDVLRLLALSDILACPSHAETFCMSVFEAMAAGVPVVSTRVWGPVDYIQDGVNGLLVPIGDWRQLAAGI